MSSSAVPVHAPDAHGKPDVAIMVYKWVFQVIPSPSSPLLFTQEIAMKVSAAHIVFNNNQKERRDFRHTGRPMNSVRPGSGERVSSVQIGTKQLPVGQKTTCGFFLTA